MNLKTGIFTANIPGFYTISYSGFAEDRFGTLTNVYLHRNGKVRYNVASRLPQIAVFCHHGIIKKKIFENRLQIAV